MMPTDPGAPRHPWAERMLIFAANRCLPFRIVGQGIAVKSADRSGSVAGQVRINVGSVGEQRQFAGRIEAGGELDALASSLAAVGVDAEASDLRKQLDVLPVDQERG